MSRREELRAALVAAPWARHLRGTAKQAVEALKYPSGRSVWEANRILLGCSPDLLLDVGANVGQFARGVRSSGYRGRILSLEPVDSERRHIEKAASHDANWRTVGVAAGAASGVARINVAGNHGLSSSLLPMEPRHLAAFPESAYVRHQDVAVVRLDEMDDEWLHVAQRIFIKIDTQGYEQQVLEGAAGLLPRVVGIRCEVSLAPLYSGEWTLPEALGWIEQHGMSVRHIVPGVADPATNEALQVDLVALRDPGA
jgi:FkbM family methyltransferase